MKAVPRVYMVGGVQKLRSETTSTCTFIQSRYRQVYSVQEMDTSLYEALEVSRGAGDNEIRRVSGYMCHIIHVYIRYIYIRVLCAY